MKSKHLVSISSLPTEDILELFKMAYKLKRYNAKRITHNPLKGKSLGMIFRKPSTRTRVSFEVGMYQLGGYALFLSDEDLQLKRGETIEDTIKTLSRYLDGLMIRTFNHSEVLDLANYGTIPIINGLTDLLHPCQVLSDIYTILEKEDLIRNLENVKGPSCLKDISKLGLSGVRVAFVGDGNNVANSWINGASKFGIKLIICPPSGYEPNQDIMKEGRKLAKRTGGEISISHNPKEAVKDADVIYTDVWTSMGKEEEASERNKTFKKYQVNKELVSQAKEDCIVMHCLPAHRGEEITDEVMDGKHSVVFDQAENRLHVQKAILALLLGQR